MSDDDALTEQEPEAPLEPISARYHCDGPFIRYSACGLSAASLADLAKLLGVEEARLVPPSRPGGHGRSRALVAAAKADQGQIRLPVVKMTERAAFSNRRVDFPG
jgi:hypothetical protein